MNFSKNYFYKSKDIYLKNDHMISFTVDFQISRSFSLGFDIKWYRDSKSIMIQLGFLRLSAGYYGIPF